MTAFEKRYPSASYVIVVPTTALLDQWYVSLREDLGVQESDIACFSGQERAKDFSRVNLMVINTARSLAPQAAQHQPSLLIVDECHRAGSPSNAAALRGDYAGTLGLSATPRREYDDGFDRYIASSLGPVVYEYGYEQAHVDGVISHFELINVEVELLPDERNEYEKLTRRLLAEIRRLERGEGSKEGVTRLLQRRAGVSAAASMRLPVAAGLAERHRGVRTLIFHERVDAASALYRMLEERGHRVTVYHSKIGPHLRRNNLQLYRRGLFDVLISCRALDEGMNVPETEVAIVASSTASARQRIQRLGRVLRPAIGKTQATVYTIFATEPEKKRLKAEADELEGVARTSWLKGGVKHSE